MTDFHVRNFPFFGLLRIPWRRPAQPAGTSPKELGIARVASNRAFAMRAETCLVWSLLREKGAKCTAMRCSKCARDNPDDAKFCVGCGNPFGRRCAKCGVENPADASFCKQCGARLRGIV